MTNEARENRTPNDLKSPPIFDGPEETCRELVELHYRFLRINDAIDSERLGELWSDDPRHVFFPANGFAYTGVSDFAKLWAFYRTKLETVAPFPSGQIRVVARGDMGLVTDDHVGRLLRNRPGFQNPDSDFERQPYVRTTEVFVRENGSWTCVHTHFSAGNLGPRPEQRGT